MAIFDSAPWSPIMGGARGIVPSNLDMMLRNMGYGQALTSGGSFGGATNGGSQNGPQNDSMVGGLPDVQTTGFFGTDLFKDPTIADMSDKARANQPSAVPGLPGLPSAPQAPTSPAATIDTKTPSESLGTAMRGTADDTSYGGQNDSSPTGTTGSPAGSTAAQSPDQDNTGGIGAGSTATSAANPNAPDVAGLGMAHTGVTPSGENGFGGGVGVGGGDGGGGGVGSGPNGVGNPGDAGSGTPGAGQSGEGGQWRKGGVIPDDGDDKLEAVPGQTLHETEGVLNPEAMKFLGGDLVKQINRVALSKLPDNQKKALIRALWS